ncbi:MAG TPA: ligase-associated DNA damage response endonuclease PdeM [Phycisphaerales bacterium]|nr:ligase-associated DNA damage response endonuclease PdeM [Phycisphaerales bacterium]
MEAGKAPGSAAKKTRKPREQEALPDFPISFGGERLRLLPSRCAYWPARRTLLLADAHLGKTETFAAHGIALPAGMLERLLETLGNAIRSSGASRVIVVGDWLHAPAGLTETLVETVRAWRAGIRAEIVVVPGNHDRKIETVADVWDLGVVDGCFRDGALSFCHMPEDADPSQPTICGHIHPVVVMATSADALKLPSFVVDPMRMLLPAFNTFTAGVRVPRRPERSFFAIGAGEVWALRS